MEPLNIKYTFFYGEQWKQQKVFPISIDPAVLEIAGELPQSLPAWARLDFYQCSHCPLSPDQTPYCPVAANLVPIVQELNALLSYHKVKVEVQTQERITTGQTTVQNGVRSMIGLIMAVSGCPHTIYFKPMARFHLPLANEAETIYRAASMYLLAQFFLKQDGHPIDMKFEGLKKIYQDIQVVNYTIAARLREASKTDSVLNAVVELDIYAQTLSIVIAESLEELRETFSSYLKPFCT